MHARNGALPTIKVVRAELQDRFAKKVGRFGTGTTAHRGYASSIATT
ncbi:MAG: hypothetical protein M5U08_16450 [Burkholderiales bacterium]|nr:hypothetical protein [Burkholderiales bacterium]